MAKAWSTASNRIVQDAWALGARIGLNGWAFELHSGRIHPQTGRIENHPGLSEICRYAKGLIGH